MLDYLIISPGAEKVNTPPRFRRPELTMTHAGSIATATDASVGIAAMSPSILRLLRGFPVGVRTLDIVVLR